MRRNERLLEYSPELLLSSALGLDKVDGRGVAARCIADDEKIEALEYVLRIGDDDRDRGNKVSAAW